MESCIIEYLGGRGYRVNTTALDIINLCDMWYSNEVIDSFHKRSNLNGQAFTIDRMNFASRCCADDANLCEVISVTPEETSDSEQFIDDLLEDNDFDVLYRDQLEKTSALGTTGAYVNLKNADYYKNADGTTTAKGGRITINYVDADCIVPLTVENKRVVECAFGTSNIVKGKKVTTLVIFTMNNNGNYTAETVHFDERGVKQDLTSVQLGPVKPFAIMQVAKVNNIKGMEGYGLPKIYNNIPLFKSLDLAYAILHGDLDKGQKLLFLNELLAYIERDESGRAVLTPQQKELFILLGEKLPDQDSLIYEYNPDIRVDAITKSFELVLSLISMAFGYGTKKYSFEDGQITTATEYIGEKQDEMQELNRQRKQATQYIEDIIRAAMWYSNTFKDTNYDLEEDLHIEFDDSYIEDKGAKLDMMRNDALSFPEIPQLKVWYLMDAYQVSEEEAMDMIQDMSAAIEGGEDEEVDDDFNLDDTEIDNMIAELGE